MPGDPFDDYENPFLDAVPQKKGTLLSILDFLDRGGQVVRNVGSGNFEGAARQTADIAGDTIDAFLPGDWIPEFSRPQDYVSGGDLIGLHEPGLAKTAADIGIGTLTDPLTYLTFGAGPTALKAMRAAATAGKTGLEASAAARIAAKEAAQGFRFRVPFTDISTPLYAADKMVDPLSLAGQGISKAASKVGSYLPDGVTRAIGDGLGEAGNIGRRIFGMEPKDPYAAALLDRSRASGSLDAQAAMAATKKALVDAGFDDRQLNIIGDASDNFRYGPDGRVPIGHLIDESIDPIMGKQAGGVEARLRAHPDFLPTDDVAKLAAGVEQMHEIGRSMKVRPHLFAADDLPNLSDEYLARGYEGLPENELLDMRSSATAATKNRKLPGWREVAEMLTKPGNEKVTYQRNALQRLASRAEQQGMLGRRSDLGAGVMELLRSGHMTLPPEMIEAEAAKQAAKKFPVGSGDNGFDIMGAKMDPLDPHPVGDFSGTSKPPVTGPIDETIADPMGIGQFSGKSVTGSDFKPVELGVPPVDHLADPYGLGTSSGRAKPPTSGKSSPWVQHLLAGDLKAARSEVERMAKGGELDEASTRAYLNVLDEAEAKGLAKPAEAAVDDAAETADPYGLGSFSGKSKPPNKTAFPELGPSPDHLADPYGLGAISGKAKPPATPKIESTIEDPMGIGQFSGKAKPPKADNVFDIEGVRKPTASGNEAYGVGSQSGEAVVGKSTVKQPPKPLPETAGPRGYTPDQLKAAKESLLAKTYAHADPDMKAIVAGAIKKMGETDPESAKMLMDQFGGMAPRGAFTSWLASANKVFKPFAVYGFAIPKFGSIVRNKIGGAWQALSNPESRGAFGGQAKRIESDLRGAVVDSLGLKIGKDKFSRILDAWETALSNSGGSPEKALAEMAKVDPKAAELFKAGITDGFVRSEDLIAEMKRTGWQKKYANVTEWPARIFRGVEDRMRLGMGLDLMEQGHNAESAARVSGESLLKYDVTSVENRAARDAIPFWQFTAKSIPQQAKFLSRTPAVGVAIDQVAHEDKGSPVYPYMEGKLNVPLGGGDYATGFGLPFETLNSIPDFSGSPLDAGRDIERNIVGSSQPLLKTLYSLVSNKDPYFESPYGSYDKVPLVGSAGNVGRAYNALAGTGLIPQVDTPLRLANQAFGSDREGWKTALDLLTGANVVSVDPDRALQQQLSQYLARNPDVVQSRSLYSQSKDPETQALIHALNEAKKRIKAKRKAATPPE